ncbi:SulP family inorganic anion transporter [Luteolibacter pohnpeiensis]|uniref:SulP family inorganic anion transporter n=1 Tax=Luteolibacter pohnpeiensis TaxID=454153 RepID=A0A934VX82_9BACT|nr:SulP family inorganic anion transporter [Luteolibacter pohnpeiensis]MBK1884075.1 SulP family inorganic anion transporter [Luteolibacter pohnpeiensis]
MKSFPLVRKATRNLRDFFSAGHLKFGLFQQTLSTYQGGDAWADARAAVSVTMLAIAQGLAFAAIAGLPVVYGVLCAAVAPLVAPFFSGSRHTILGPTNATAFMLFSFFSVNPALAGRWNELMPLLVFMVGLFATLGALFRVADLLQYISRSVLVGYITGAAALIVVNQLRSFLGVAAYMEGGDTSTFFGMVLVLVKALRHTDPVSVAIGGSTLAVYVGFRKWRPQWPAFALTLFLSSLTFGWLIHSKIGPFAGASTFSTFALSDLMPGMPQIFREGIFQDISALLGVGFAIAFLASLENTLMAKSLASMTGDNVDVNQDMLAVGIANLASAMTGGMPASGSLTRSMLNHDAGAKTRFASFFAGIYTLIFAVVIAMSVDWGMPLVDHVPKAALAALVIALSVGMFNVRNIRICLRSTRDDAWVLVATFFATLIAPLHVAIFIGVAVSITLFLRKASRPSLIEYEFSDEGQLREIGEKNKRPIPAISIVHVEGDLFFGAAELFRTQIQRTVSDPAIKVIILRMKNAHHLDATSVMALEDLIKFLRSKNLHLLISGATREVYWVLKKSGVLETLQQGCNRKEGETNLFLNWPSNPNLSTRDALKRAQQLLGTDEAEIRIFYDANKKD